LRGAAAPTLGSVATYAQQPDHMRRVGMLMNGAATEARPQAYVKAFTESLSKAGWIEGKNISIVTPVTLHWRAFSRRHSSSGLMPDVILASSTTNLTMIREVTNTGADRVHGGVRSDRAIQIHRRSRISSCGRSYDFSVGCKWLGLLKQMAPDLARIAVMFRNTPGHRPLHTPR
jgi:putative tryptophan/tyrosine transport system substrate-binding protein